MESITKSNPLRRKSSTWNVENMLDAAEVAENDENQSQNQQQQVAAPISQRRQSARILEKQNEMNEENEQPPSKKPRGRPPNENKKQSKSKTSNKTGTGTQASHSSSSPPTNPNDANQSDPNVDDGFDFGIKAKNPKFNNRYSAKCTLCNEQEDRIKYLKGKNTNLKSHLERMHPKQYEIIYTEAKKNEMEKGCLSNEFTDTDIESAVLNFIIKERLSLRIVESDHLKRLIQVCLNSRSTSSAVHRYLKRGRARKKIQALAAEMRKHFKECFKKVEYFCATSDIWSRSNKSFIAVSLHYFDPITLEMRTQFIACEPFPGHHTHDRVAQKLHGIFDRLDILNRVYFVTTDGATEYGAAFKYFGHKHGTIHLMNASEGNFDWMNRSYAGDGAGTSADDGNSGSEPGLNQNSNKNGANSDTLDSDSSDDDDDDPDLYVRSLETNSDDDKDYDDDDDADNANDSGKFRIHRLPFSSHALLANMQRVDCSAHKLDKLGKIDVKLAFGHDKDYDSCHERVFAKLDQIWSLKDSRLKAEAFTRITHRKIVPPHRIRWFKSCEAIGNILSIDRNKLENACIELNIDPFTLDEYNFLRQYFEIINKVAIALKVLEGDKHQFGLYLPTLFGLRAVLNKYADAATTKTPKCLQLAIALQTGFKERFGNLMDLSSPDGKSTPLYIAMITNPTYKLNFMGTRIIDPRVLNTLKDMLVTAALENERTNNSMNGSTVSVAQQNHGKDVGSTHKEGGLNELLIENDVSASFQYLYGEKERITKEMEAYMSTPTNPNIKDGLANFPSVRRLYLKYNCVRSSEAICERMFSYAGMILTDKRARLTPDFFEDLLLLHMNE